MRNQFDSGGSIVNNMELFFINWIRLIYWIFFTNCTKITKCYSTLNVYRSAISLLLSNELKNNPHIQRFFKGLSNIHPQQPKYSVIWDPSIVLNYLTNLSENEQLPLELLTKKTATLLALVTAQRVQTLSKIRIENIQLSREKISIKIPDKLKTSRRNVNQPILEIPFFSENTKICPATTLQYYIRKTTDIRNVEMKFLFMTYKKPHHIATSQTISRWIKQTLDRSGINTEIYSAHSTRHASTSAAARSGINIETIRKAAGWTEQSQVFAKFYKKPLISNEIYGTSILDPGQSQLFSDSVNE